MPLVNLKIIEQLISMPESQLECFENNNKITAQILIPHYIASLRQFYGEKLLPNIEVVKHRFGIGFTMQHFGLKIRFAKPVSLNLHDKNMDLSEICKRLITLFGTVIIENAYLPDSIRDIGHKNRFPHLNFHRDCNESQPTPYSLYTRNPFDPTQAEPRTSSTLFIPNIVAYLQCMKEHSYDQINTKGVKSHYNIFHQQDMTEVINKIMLEHSWNLPEGIGEISMLDNRTMLHASYQKNGVPGYRIGVRYLG